MEAVGEMWASGGNSCSEDDEAALPLTKGRDLSSAAGASLCPGLALAGISMDMLSCIGELEVEMSNVPLSHLPQANVSCNSAQPRLAEPQKGREGSSDLNFNEHILPSFIGKQQKNLLNAAKSTFLRLSTQLFLYQRACRIMQDIIRVPAFVSPVSLKWCRAQHRPSLVRAVGVNGVDVERALPLEAFAVRLGSLG